MIKLINPNYCATVVKEEMWRDISKSYNIELIYEDRNQVVRRARALNLKVAQVKYGNY